MTDSLLPPETFSDAMDEAARVSSVGSWSGHPPTMDSSGEGDARGTLTIDRDLGPVNASPKPKGPKARLQKLREWNEETWPPGPRRRALKEKRR
jgi:hypothetical protein